LAALSELVRFAKSEGQLAHTWNELSLLDKIELPPVEVESYTPEQLSQLLDAARPNLIPLIVLQAFGGVRHEEVQKMDWRDINLKNGFIRIKSIVGKTKKMRLIQMQPNLVAWLRIYAKTNGPICPITHTSNAIVRTKQRAGLPAGRGQLTNALRSGFGSHRLAQTNDIGLVAREMGNSPNIIKEHYLELVSPDEAKAWFNLWPKKHANVIDWDKADLPFNKNRSQIDPQQKTAS
jgi:integrase